MESFALNILFYIYIYTFIHIHIHLDANDLWNPHFVNEAAVYSREETERRNFKVKHGASDYLVRTTSHKTMYQYHFYHLPIPHTHTHTTLTHIHTRIVCLATIFKIRGTQFVTLYGIHISMLPIYIYIYKRPYIFI
jgi:hypothetical protein